MRRRFVVPAGVDQRHREHPPSGVILRRQLRRVGEYRKRPVVQAGLGFHPRETSPKTWRLRLRGLTPSLRLGIGQKSTHFVRRGAAQRAPELGQRIPLGSEVAGHVRHRYLTSHAAGNQHAVRTLDVKGLRPARQRRLEDPSRGPLPSRVQQHVAVVRPHGHRLVDVGVGGSVAFAAQEAQLGELEVVVALQRRQRDGEARVAPGALQQPPVGTDCPLEPFVQLTPRVKLRRHGRVADLTSGHWVLGRLLSEVEKLNAPPGERAMGGLERRAEADDVVELGDHRLERRLLGGAGVADDLVHVVRRQGQEVADMLAIGSLHSQIGVPRQRSGRGTGELGHSQGADDQYRGRPQQACLGGTP